MRTVREDCFAGERIVEIEHAREMARRWCREEYGMRRHSTTQRRPLEHFEADERPMLCTIDDALIQPYSGHASRQSLEIYSRLAIGEAQREYEQVIGRFPV